MMVAMAAAGVCVRPECFIVRTRFSPRRPTKRRITNSSDKTKIQRTEKDVAVSAATTRFSFVKLFDDDVIALLLVWKFRYLAYLPPPNDVYVHAENRAFANDSSNRWQRDVYAPNAKSVYLRHRTLCVKGYVVENGTRYRCFVILSSNKRNKYFPFANYPHTYEKLFDTLSTSQRNNITIRVHISRKIIEINNLKHDIKKIIDHCNKLWHRSRWPILWFMGVYSPNWQWNFHVDYYEVQTFDYYIDKWQVHVYYINIKFCVIHEKLWLVEYIILLVPWIIKIDTRYTRSWLYEIILFQHIFFVYTIPSLFGFDFNDNTNKV